MATRGVPLRNLSDESNDYFNTSYNPRPVNQYLSDDGGYTSHGETPLDLNSTPGSHRALLSNPIGQDDNGSGPGEKVNEFQNTPARWRPYWLRPSVLSIFVALFLLFTACLPVMYWYSQEHDGLLKTRQNLVYLWRFGPTAVLTLISMFWNRVELQAIRYMPWMAHRQAQLDGQEADVSDLDYTAMLSPVILFQSLKRKHFLVFFICIASFLLKLQIVLAPSLYSLASISVTETADIQLHNIFNTSISGSNGTDNNPYLIAMALNNFNLSYPFGVNENLAYQTFGTGNGTVRGTTDAPLKAVVDGYFSEMQCLQLEDYSIRSTEVDRLGYHTYNFSLKFPGCDTTIPHTSSRILWNNSTAKRSRFAGYWGLKPSIPERCLNLPQQNNQSLYLAARLGPSTQNSSQPFLVNVAAVLCTSTSWLSKVEVVDDGVSPKVRVLPNQTNTTVFSDLWAMISASGVGNMGYSATTGVVSGPVAAMKTFRGEDISTGPNVTDATLYTNEALYNSVMDMSRTLGPLLAHYRRRQDSQSPAHVTGSIALTYDKLMVTQWVCLTMAACFAFLSLLISCLLLVYKRRTAVWYRDPATILGNMIYFRDNPRFAERVVDYKSPSRDHPVNWDRSEFTPLVLRTWVRALFAIFTLAVIAGLSSALNISESSDGLATVREDGYMHLLWTSLPALVMLGIALYVSCCDFAFRGLAVLWCLSSRSCSADELDVTLVDMLGLRALYNSLQKRVWTVTLSQLLALMCAFLTTLISVIFTVESIPENNAIQLQQNSWFGSFELGIGLDGLSSSRRNRDVLSSLLTRQGESELTYPQNTYNELVFPVLGGLESLDTSPNMTVKATIPAAKLQSTCTKLLPNEYRVSIKNWTEETTYYEGDFRQPYTCPNGKQGNVSDSITLSAATHKLGLSYFASVFASPGNLGELNTTCQLGLSPNYTLYSSYRVQTYAWGLYSNEKKDFEYLSLWKCNYTWVEIPTTVNLAPVKGKYVLDPDAPPQPDVSNSKPWVPTLEVPHLNNKFHTRGVGNAFPQSIVRDPLAGQMDEQFTVLIEPYGRFPLTAFNDTSQEDGILKDLRRNYAFLSAQLVNLENRYNMTESSWDSPPPAGGLPAVNAVITNHGRRRLVQNPTITYVLIGIIAVVALANIWALCSALTRRLVGRSWLFDMEVKGLAPDGFHSMAAMGSLLQGSNVANHLPESTELLSSDELHGRLSGLNFRLGWFQKAMGQESVYTIGVEGDDGLQYLGSKASLATQD
ncbi:uncharacterized protein CTRU02_209081 [Colletotrichum truncatum]|uniref:Uncharacterized protein n=1 Tax=Colletotrichum truncatum TaxID=5467 RepID=A0ACC3YY28_COLTU|nr:uncharacterized protein CTRU02_07728 [Colletotrichum truncatum]KAF6790822.1 hypothetical protein CTRU02_07728 [Colletotrichum truncatum]